MKLNSIQGGVAGGTHRALAAVVLLTVLFAHAGAAVQHGEMSANGVAPMPTFDVAKPDAVLVDGVADDAGRVAISPQGAVAVVGAEPISKVSLVWNVALPKDVLLYGGAWERTYGDAGWYGMDDAKAPMKGWKPWYFLANDGRRTDGYGLMVQPNVFGAWRVEPERVVLSLDLRAATKPLRLKDGRVLAACTLVARCGAEGETPYAAARAFCRAMCPNPRLPKTPVYGYNDWNCMYGKNSATNFLADVEAFMECCKGLENRPYIVVDDGWQLANRKTAPVDGLWGCVRPQWGMPMHEVASRVKAMGGRPGLWYRPFLPWRAAPEEMKAGDDLDLASPAMREHVKHDIERFRKWGMEIVKIDFITKDWAGVYGPSMADTPMMAKNLAWRDDSRTTAEVVRDLYAAMREAAGDEVLIIGCNALDHFAAGLFELQRTGNDTSGREWVRTLRLGVNTLGERMHHDRTFYVADGDCVGQAMTGDVTWEKNRNWLDLVANSGTALFVSWRRELLNDEVRDALTEACRKASMAQPVAEPMDWMQNLRPEHWRFGEREKGYRWHAP